MKFKFGNSKCHDKTDSSDKDEEKKQIPIFSYDAAIKKIHNYM